MHVMRLRRYEVALFEEFNIGATMTAQAIEMFVDQENRIHLSGRNEQDQAANPVIS
jgi:hypothetical protein